MTFANVKLIIVREVRDQLRDRRTLFVVLVLPILLYPLMGMSYLQVSQFKQAQTLRVLVVGANDFSKLPPLLEEKHFAPNLFTKPEEARLLEVAFLPNPHETEKKANFDAHEEARRQVAAGDYDAALFFPPDFPDRMRTMQLQFRSECLEKSSDRPHKEIELKTSSPSASNALAVAPHPEIIYSSAKEKSQFASARLSGVMYRWSEFNAENTLKQADLSTAILQPIDLNKTDIAGSSSLRGAAIWANVLPIMLLLCALTGAFYPAVDLCAGEKERGTLETLLSSPAERSEIVIGKLLTIMLFSIVTSVLNLVSGAITGFMAFSRLEGFASPSPLTFLWLALALLPVAAFFSALCLALAAFARSSKEGQYYLMPAMIITMPLVILPMSPGVQLNLGCSLIPITGIVLLLKALLEGNYLPALQYAPVVIGVTAFACLLSIRWAIDQFNSESVLFRESERLDLKLWLKRLYIDRKPTPTIGVSLSCAVLILILHFFLGLLLVTPKTTIGFVEAVLVPQLAVVLLPTLLMTFLLTRKASETLLLKLPRLSAVAAAILLALSIHPAVTVMSSWVSSLYPIDPEVQRQMGWLNDLLQHENLLLLLALVALTPAICEELAIRGFVLSGLRHWGHRWRAIVLSAIIFGLIHGILQQSINAFFVGLILGFIAVQSGSILPCMAFHFTHNSLAVLGSRITPELFEKWPGLHFFMTLNNEGGMDFHWVFTGLCSVLAILLMIWFGLLTHAKTTEEQLQEAIVRGKQQKPDEEDVSISLAPMIK